MKHASGIACCARAVPKTESAQASYLGTMSTQQKNVEQALAGNNNNGDGVNKRRDCMDPEQSI